VSALRELGLEIRRCREREKWTLEQAAEVMGLDYRHLAKIENGTLNPTAFTLFRIAQGLRISLDALAGNSARDRRHGPNEGETSGGRSQGR
jgi:transcriptional regulator with XRE-family HTH domain